jgi:hypothetical protein
MDNIPSLARQACVLSLARSDDFAILWRSGGGLCSPSVKLSGCSEQGSGIFGGNSLLVKHGPAPPKTPDPGRSIRGGQAAIFYFIVSTSPRRKTGQSWPKSPETTDRSRSVRHRSTCGVNLEGWAPRGWPPFKCTGPPWTKLIIGAAGCATLPRHQTAAEAEDTAQSAAPLERQITNGDSRAFSRTAVAVLPSERVIRVVRRLWLSNAPR